MAITKAFALYTKVLDVDTDWMIQIDLSNQNISEVTGVYTRPVGITEVNSFSISEDIESDFQSSVGGTDAGYYQYKNGILHIASIGSFTNYATDEFWITAKRLPIPIESLDDDLDIPDSLVPLFVNKVLANIYHLQGKEVPITIKRKIKELE